MKYYKGIISIWFAILSFFSNSQEWHQVYFPSKPSYVNAVYESYDNGYVLGGNFQPNSIPTRGLIIKTDINGEMLWHKVISEHNSYTRVMDINQTSDGGMILTGYTGEQTEYSNPFIMKVNPCGESEWCTIYNTPNPDPEWGESILQIPGGYIAYFHRYGEDPQNQRIWLYRLDNEGGIIWIQCYAQTDTLIQGEKGVSISISPDYLFLITGYCYYPNPNNPNYLWLRPFLIKVDTTGYSEWELPWALVDGENYYGQSFKSLFDNQGNIYSSGRHIIIDGPLQGDKPAMIKTDQYGNPTSYSNFFTNTYQGLTLSINWFADSTIAFGAGWVYPGGDEHVGVIKADKSGNVIKTKDMFSDNRTFSDAETTFDNKLLLVGGFWDGIWRSHAYKLNSDLEYDSIYTQPFVYDSLCPYPIPSDTIPLDCVVVGMDDPFVESEKSSLKVYPNPASNKIHIVIPEQLKTETAIPSFNVTTVYHQWHSAILEIYDLFGRKMYSKEVRKGDQEFEIDVSSWQVGMYVVRLVYRGETMATEKVVVK